MIVFTVTASNRYYWQKLAVQARNADVAEKKFARFLASRSSQREEVNEWIEGEKRGAEVERCPRSHYVYSFDPDAIEPIDCVSPVGVVVEMIGSGGNG